MEKVEESCENAGGVHSSLGLSFCRNPNTAKVTSNVLFLLVLVTLKPSATCDVSIVWQVNNHANMTHQSSDASDIVPAHLDFLAIFSPDLGQSERTEQDQIVFYWSKPTRTRGKKRRQDAEQLVKQAKEEENERMRQIGLAQGMVNFAR